MKLHVVPAKQGWVWVKLGMQTFWRQPLAFTGLFFLFMAAVSVLSVIPVLGAILSLVILPAATLGLMVATEQASAGKFPMPMVLMVAFRAGQQRLKSMLILGALYALCFLLVMALSTLIDGGGFAKVYLANAPHHTRGGGSRRFSNGHLDHHPAVRSHVYDVLACACTGSLAWRTAC